MFNGVAVVNGGSANPFSGSPGIGPDPTVSKSDALAVAVM